MTPGRLILSASLLLAVFPAEPLPAQSVDATAAPPSAPASASSPSGAMVPQEVLDKMDAQVKPPDKPVSRDQAADMLEKGLRAILTLGAQAEKDYAGTENLYLVRMRMLQAATTLRGPRPTKEADQLVVDIAQRVVDSPAPAEAKAQADWMLTHARMREANLAGPPAVAAVREYAARYADSNAAARSLAYATILAYQFNLKDLKEELADQLQSKYSGDPEIKDLLRRLGRSPDVGQPFEAEATRLDGTKLVLPKDLLGKVVVIDFWATWCPPCREEVPHMKEVYAKYAAKGVEFVGFSSDRKKEDLVRYVKDQGMNWIHTYDGPAFPTFKKYGIEAIPSIWVVGKDGNVFSDDARRNLEATLDKALAAPAK